MLCSSSSMSDRFSPGEQVEIRELQSASGAKFNGERGVVLGFSDRGRVEVSLPDGTSKAFKADNLFPVKYDQDQGWAVREAPKQSVSQVSRQSHSAARMPGDDDFHQRVAQGHNRQVAQLLARLTEEIEDTKPPNVIHFVVDFLCNHYPEHLHGFSSIWSADPELEKERQDVCRFFRNHKISTQIAAHFTNAGYDTIETIATLTPDTLVHIEAFNNVHWLPGHKVRLQQLFADIGAKVREFKQQHQPAYPHARGVVAASAPPARYVAASSSPPTRPTTFASSGNPVVYTSSQAVPTVVPQQRSVSPSRVEQFIASQQQSSAMPPQYASGSSKREYNVAAVTVDADGDGRPDFIAVGADRNRDGIPDALQQPPLRSMLAPPQMLQAPTMLQQQTMAPTMPMQPPQQGSVVGSQFQPQTVVPTAQQPLPPPPPPPQASSSGFQQQTGPLLGHFQPPSFNPQQQTIAPPQGVPNSSFNFPTGVYNPTTMAPGR